MSGLFLGVRVLALNVHLFPFNSSPTPIRFSKVDNSGYTDKVCFYSSLRAKSQLGSICHLCPQQLLESLEARVLIRPIALLLV